MDVKNVNTEKKSYLDFNASWPLMILYIVYLGGMIFLQRAIFDTNFGSSNYNYFVFIFLSILIGLIVSALLYNLGKILFAKIAGYEIVYAKCFGLTIDKSKGKAKFSYHILEIADLELKFAPKDDDIEKNPKLIFLGGFCFELLFIALCLLLFFLLSSGSSNSMGSFIGYMSLFAMIYGLIVLIYEAVPFRQDTPTDMFNLLVLKNKEEIKAYNVFNVNRRRELNGKDFLVVPFDSYTSYYKAHNLYFLYLDKLYSNDLQEAVNILDTMKLNKKRLDEGERYITSSESLYLRYLIDDIDGADKLYLQMKSDEKHSVTKPTELADFRTSLLVLGYISGDKTSTLEGINEVTKKFKLKTEGLEESKRVKKEKALFEQAYKSLKTHKPELNLPESY